MEQVFFRLHLRFVTAVTRVVSPATRRALEALSLTNACVLLLLLGTLHTSFISAPWEQQTCLVDVLRAADFDPARDVLELRIGGLWAQWADVEDADAEVLFSADQEAALAADAHAAAAEPPSSVEGLVDSLLLEVRRGSRGLREWKEDPLFQFSLEKGLLLLPEERRADLGVRTVNVTVASSSPCLGATSMRLLLEHVIGFDTVVMNAFIKLHSGHGFLTNVHSRELYNLNYASEFMASTENAETFVLFKVGVLLTTLFLFFTTTTLVSFTLRETQERMLKFTFLLQHYVRNRIPYASLIFTHVVESLVFVPIMVGILFFLFEFFNDQLLAFMVLSVVWLCEVYSVISLRTVESIRFFPRAFFCFFTLFHVYFFSFPFGFSYVALATTVSFLQYVMMYFWNHHEVPALQSGIVTAASPRVEGVVSAEDGPPAPPPAAQPQAPAGAGGGGGGAAGAGVGAGAGGAAAAAAEAAAAAGFARLGQSSRNTSPVRRRVVSG